MKFLLQYFTLTLCLLVSTVYSLNFHYHDFEEIQDFLKNTSSIYPDLTRLYSIGKSVEGRELWVLEVSAVNRSKDQFAPNVKIIGNIHGNEPIGKEMILHLIDYLVSQYDNDSSVSMLLNNTRIHFLPAMNPDGSEESQEGFCSSGPGRENNNGTDLNRDFPDLHGQARDELTRDQQRQPETKAIMHWMQENKFILSASLHGGALVANYPFENKKDGVLSNSESKSPDDDVFKHLATMYANTHPTMHQGVRCEGVKSFPGGITNGAAWYPVLGGMQDYNYLAHGCLEVTMELSCCKYPADEELSAFWNENKMALLKYILEVHQGVKGIVTDSDTKQPIANASLKIAGRDATFLSDNDGHFWRILLPGTYQLEIFAPGYKQKFQDFKVTRNRSNPTTTVLHINLTNELMEDDEEEDDALLGSLEITPRFGSVNNNSYRSGVQPSRTGRSEADALEELDEVLEEYRIGELKGQACRIMQPMVILGLIIISFATM